MRDIRGDLQERAEFIEKQITAAGDDFEKAVEQLQSRLKAQLAALSVAMWQSIIRHSSLRRSAVKTARSSPRSTALITEPASARITFCDFVARAWNPNP